MGVVRVRIQRGVNLPVRDVRSSDPYLVIRMGKQNVKTRVMEKNVSPEWDEDLILSVENPSIPVRLEVYDRDLFTADDPMGSAEFDIRPFLECAKLNLNGCPDGTVITNVIPTKENCLVERSPICLSKGEVVQDIVLRLRDTECSEIELQLRLG